MEVRLNDGDLAAKLDKIAKSELVFLDHVPKPINLLEQHRKRILAIFSIRQEIQNQAVYYLNSLKSDAETPIVGVHIRLTDKRFAAMFYITLHTWARGMVRGTVDIG